MIRREDLKLNLNVGTPAEQLETEILADISNHLYISDLSQRELEELTGIKQSAISRVFTSNSTPTLLTLCKILEPLGYTLKVFEKEK